MLKILVIHNKYKYRGGEDSVFDVEVNLLKQRGNNVETLVFDNDNIQGIGTRIKYGIYSFYNPESSEKIIKLINTFKPDIVHVHNFFPIASPSVFFAANSLGIPIVMTLHNYRLLCPNAMFFRNGEICEKCLDKKFAYPGVIAGCYRGSRGETFLLATMVWSHKVIGTWNKYVDKYIALTNFAKEKYLKSALSLNENLITVKPNFVDDWGHDLTKEDYFLYVGRLSEEKGISVLLKVFSDVNHRLLIIGSGPMEEEVKKIAEKNKNINFVGFKRKHFIVEKLKKAMALVFTSTLYEGMPMTILEAFSTGTPVVCGNIGGPAEIVEDGITGLHYNIGDAEDLKSKVNWIVDNPVETEKMGKNSRKEYEIKYTPEKNYKLLINIYQEVIDAKKENNQKLN